MQRWKNIWLLFEIKPISGSGVKVHVILKCLMFCLRMNQTEELATKRVFGVITLLITDYLIFLQV